MKENMKHGTEVVPQQPNGLQWLELGLKTLVRGIPFPPSQFRNIPPEVAGKNGIENFGYILTMKGGQRKPD